MDIRRLGNSGLKVSEISFGNWLTHGAQIDDASAIACVRAALDQGITTFDTADVYANTRAETVLGEALRGERRESLVVSTKVYWPTGPGGPNDSGLSRKHIRESVDASLRRLRTDYVDLYLAHRYDYETPLEETMEAFADVVRQGKALYIGVSEWTASQIRAGHTLARELRFPFVANQPQYNMIWRVIEPDVIPVCTDLGIGQIAFSPLFQGLLTGKYEAGRPPPVASRAANSEAGNLLRGRLDDEILLRVQRLRPLANQLGLTLAQLAIAWVLANPAISSAIIGASRPEQVIENAKAAGQRLPLDIMRAIDDTLGPVILRDPSRTTSPPNRSFS